MSPDSQDIGQNIRKLRKLQHRTLQNVADNCGFTKSLLSKIESGTVVPPVATLIKIASALHTTISGLIAEGENTDSIFFNSVVEHRITGILSPCVKFLNIFN